MDYADAQVGFLRGFLEPSFTAALADADSTRLDPVWQDTRTRIAADPAAVRPTHRMVAGRLRHGG